MSQILVDASTKAPLSAAAASSKACTAFSPPASSVLFAVIGNTAGATAATGVTDSLGAHLTWTKILAKTTNSCDVEVWYAPCPSAQTNMTVTVSFTGSQDISIGVIVVTGAASNQTGAATGNATSASGTPSVGLTTTAGESYVLGVFADFTNQTAPTVNAGQSTTIGGVTFRTTLATHTNSWWAQMLTAPGGDSGNVITMADSAPTAIAYSAIAIEILPASANTLNAESAAFNADLTAVLPAGSTKNAQVNPLRGGGVMVGQAVQSSRVR